MSDAPSGFKSPHVQVAGQRRHYENTTCLRTDRRSQLEPVGAGIAGNDLVSVPVPSRQNGLSVTHQQQVSPAISAAVERRRVLTNQDMEHYERERSRRDIQSAPSTNDHPTQNFIFSLCGGLECPPGVPWTPEGGRQAVYPHCGPSQDATAEGEGAHAPSPPLPQEGVGGGGVATPPTPVWGRGGRPAPQEVNSHA
jgi:hypothetical protein